MATVGLSERIAAVRERIAQACRRCGRDPSTVTLIAVTKGVGAPIIHEAITLGLNNFGENRVQEARAKQDALGSGLWAGGKRPEPRTPNPEQIRWHLIGHLQRNKAKEAVELFDSVHSLDTADLAEALERHAAKRALGSRLKAEGKGVDPKASERERIQVFIQVNISGEVTKSGCAPEETTYLAQAVLRLPNLKLAGLMTIAPFDEDPVRARPHFRRLRELRDELVSSSSLEPRALSLSMGMSQDFEVAIEEGADIIRVGTAIFGP